MDPFQARLECLEVELEGVGSAPGAACRVFDRFLAQHSSFGARKVLGCVYQAILNELYREFVAELHGHGAHHVGAPNARSRPSKLTFVARYLQTADPVLFGRRGHYLTAARALMQDDSVTDMVPPLTVPQLKLFIKHLTVPYLHWIKHGTPQSYTSLPLALQRTLRRAVQDSILGNDAVMADFVLRDTGRFIPQQRGARCKFAQDLRVQGDSWPYREEPPYRVTVLVEHLPRIMPCLPALYQDPVSWRRALKRSRSEEARESDMVVSEIPSTLSLVYRQESCALCLEIEVGAHKMLLSRKTVRWGDVRVLRNVDWDIVARVVPGTGLGFKELGDMVGCLDPDVRAGMCEPPNCSVRESRVRVHGYEVSSVLLHALYIYESIRYVADQMAPVLTMTTEVWDGEVMIDSSIGVTLSALLKL